MKKGIKLLILFVCLLNFNLTARDLFPDGTLVPNWFKENARTDINKLGRHFRITDYGVTNDSTFVQTEKIQAVIDKAYQTGGGIIIIPKGTFLCGSLFFKPGTHLHLEKDAVLKGSDDISNFPVVMTRMEGQSLNYFAALVNANEADGFTVSGEGTLDGNGLRYWKSFWLRREVNPDCTNMEELRPRILYVSNSKNVRISGIRMINSPFWTSHFYKCENVQLFDLYIYSPFAPVKAPSTDAIDIDACTNVHIKNCYLSVNDDAIALKGGKGPFADKDSNNGSNRNIIIEDCEFGFCHSALTCGSESILNRNIIFRRNTVDGAKRLLQLKMRPDTPQIYEYILIENITGKANNLITIKPWTQFFDLNGEKEIRMSYAHDITMRNIQLECSMMFDIEESGQYKIERISFENLDITTTEIKQEAKPWTRWWWHGSAVTEQGLTAALEAYRKAGLGGVEITPIYGVRGMEEEFIDFLSPEWMEKLVYTLNEAKRLGLGVDLANASGWPFGGPWVDEAMACKNMVSRTYKLTEGETLTEKIEYIQKPLVRTQGSKKVTIEDIKEPITANENLQEYAFDQIRYEKQLPLIALTANKQKAGEAGFGESLDLTDKVKNGMLDWTAPEGEWTLCALFQGDHGKMVERAGPGGEGNVIDHFSEEALQKYLNHFDKAFSAYDLSYLRYYFNDSYEVDDAMGDANWTPEFFAEFNRIHGYNLKEYLPALLGLDNEDTNNRVLYDYRIAISDLLLERYTKNWRTWAAKQGKGIRNQSHGSPANILDLYAISDVPEIEGNEIINLKSAPSAAHVSGKRLVSSESATWLNDHFESGLGDVKAAIDQFFLAGVNHVFYHGTTYSPPDVPWPGWLFYAAVHFTPVNSFWDDFGAFNKYVARSQSFLQSGKPSNDVLLYFGIADLWSEQGRGMLYHFHSDRLFDDISMKECGAYLLENGYSWDAISDIQLQDVIYKDAGLITGGNSYKTIVLPEINYMPVSTFRKLLDLAEKGATILFYKNMPSDVPGLSDLERSRNEMNDLQNKLVFLEDGNNRMAKLGKGRIIISDNLSYLLTNADVKPETLYRKNLQCIRRLKEDGSFYYFVLNPNDQEFSDWVTLNADYASAVLYNPMTGNDGCAKVRKSEGKTEVYLQLKPQESIVVETFRGNYTGDLYPYYEKNGGGEVALSNDWTISFVKGGPVLPAEIVTKELKSWTEYGTNYVAFSGTASYKTRIPTLKKETDAWLLNITSVNESASVYLNGKYLGTLFNSPYSIEIPSGLLKGNDELTINVSNLMANRIMDMDKKGEEYRIFYNTNFNAKKRENVGKDGKFTAVNWSPKASGISGKVTMTPLMKKKFE